MNKKSNNFFQNKYKEPQNTKLIFAKLQSHEKFGRAKGNQNSKKVCYNKKQAISLSTSLTMLACLYQVIDGAFTETIQYQTDQATGVNIKYLLKATLPIGRRRRCSAIHISERPYNDSDYQVIWEWEKRGEIMVSFARQFNASACPDLENCVEKKIKLVAEDTYKFMYPKQFNFLMNGTLYLMDAPNTKSTIHLLYSLNRCASTAEVNTENDLYKIIKKWDIDNSPWIVLSREVSAQPNLAIESCLESLITDEQQKWQMVEDKWLSFYLCNWAIMLFIVPAITSALTSLIASTSVLKIAYGRVPKHQTRESQSAHSNSEEIELVVEQASPLSSFDDLPNEVLTYMFSFLEEEDLVRVMQINRKIEKLIRDNENIFERLSVLQQGYQLRKELSILLAKQKNNEAMKGLFANGKTFLSVGLSFMFGAALSTAAYFALENLPIAQSHKDNLSYHANRIDNIVNFAMIYASVVMSIVFGATAYLSMDQLIRSFYNKHLKQSIRENNSKINKLKVKEVDLNLQETVEKINRRWG